MTAPTIHGMIGSSVATLAVEAVRNLAPGWLWTSMKLKIGARTARIREWALKLWHRMLCWMVGIFALLLAQSYRAQWPPKLVRTYGRFEVVGLPYNDNIATAGERVSLVREMDNPHDPNAIRVYNSRDEGIGYISRKQAARLAPLMDKGTRIYGIVRGKADRWRLIVEILEDQPA